MDERKHKQFAEKILGVLISSVKNFEGGVKYLTYGELAALVDFPKPYTGNNFGRLMGETLGVMGHMFDGIAIRGESIPMIQALVVAQTTKLPGKGLKEFYPGYETLTTEKKHDLANKEYQKIFEFGDNWLLLAEELNIDLDEPQGKRHISAKHLKNPYGSEGSPEHRAIRDYIAAHPELLDLPAPVEAHTEYPLKSGDSVDVVLKYEGRIVGIEVKSHRSGDDDLERGLYQCIKYEAVLKAEELISNSSNTVECILVIEGGFPRALVKDQRAHGVKVYDNISPAELG